MRNFIYISLFLLLQQTVTSQVDYPVLEKYKLKNGLQVIFAGQGSLPVTFVKLYVHTGVKNETPGFQSIATLTSDALLLGNEKYTRIQQDELLQKLGTSISSSSNDSYSEMSISFLNKDMDAGMELFSSVVLKPAFPVNEIKQMIQRKIDYNKPSKMDIADLAAIFSAHFVFGPEAPLGRYFHAKQLLALNRDSIELFYKFNYTPKNATLVIGGKPDQEKLKKLVELYFGGWKAAYGETNSASYEILPLKKKEYGFIHKEKAPQTALQWNKLAPDAKSKDLLIFRIANLAFSERLFKEIRQKDGYTYGIGSNYSARDNNGIFYVSTLVRSEVTYNAITEFDRVLKDLFEKGITESELEEAKTRFKGSVLAMESPDEFIEFVNPLLYPDYEKRKMYLDEINKLDLPGVNKAVKKYFTPDSYKLVISGDETKLQDQLAKLPELKKFSFSEIQH